MALLRLRTSDQCQIDSQLGVRYLRMSWRGSSAFFLLPRFPALYTGLTAGFCGCYTTFSSWMSASGAIIARGQLARGLLSVAVGLSLALHACKVGKDHAVPHEREW